MARIPGVNHLAALRAPEKAGFRILRQGKHIVMTDGTRIPRNNPINAMGVIVRNAGLTGSRPKVGGNWMEEKSAFPYPEALDLAIVKASMERKNADEERLPQAGGNVHGRLGVFAG